MRKALNRSEEINIPRNETRSVSRWWVCFCTWGLLASGAVIVEFAGIMPQNAAASCLLVLGVLVAGSIAWGWASHRLPQVSLLVATLLLVLMGTECILRFTIMAPLTDHNRALFEYDSVLGWRFVSGAVEPVIKPEYENTVKINSHGFRDRDYALDRSGAGSVVGVIGDSFTSNMGVTFPELFSEEMARRLGPDLAVRNYGVNGYGQVQELLLLKKRLQEHPIDLLVLLFYFRNDFDDNLGTFDWIRLYERPRARVDTKGELRIENQPDTPPTEMPGESRTAQQAGLTQSLALCRLVNQAFDACFPSVRPLHDQAPEVRFCRREYTKKEQEALVLTKALIAEMKKTAEARNSRFAVVLAPSLWQIDSEKWSSLLHRIQLDEQDFERNGPQQRLARICTDLGIPCLDLLPVFEEYAGRGENLYYPLETHWTAKGNQRAGEAIADWLKENSLFQAGR